MALLSACHTSKPADRHEAASDVVAVPVAAPVRTLQAMPKALVYKTNVPCADNVAISLNPAGTAVQSYPAPTDVSAASAPLQLPGGWLLDRRGIGPNTAFIRLTYAEYAALPQAPSASELMAMVLPGVHVTEARRLDMTPQQAAADTAAVVRAIEQF